jgi:hypothetical protein
MLTSSPNPLKQWAFRRPRSGEGAEMPGFSADLMRALRFFWASIRVSGSGKIHGRGAFQEGLRPERTLGSAEGAVNRGTSSKRQGFNFTAGLMDFGSGWHYRACPGIERTVPGFGRVPRLA